MECFFPFILTIVYTSTCTGFSFVENFVNAKIVKWHTCLEIRKDDLNFIRISIKQCITECSLRKGCEFLGYDARLGSCELYFTASLTDRNERGESCAFIFRRDMDLQEIAAVCSCSEGQVCDVHNGQCIFEECQPFNLTNGFVYGNMRKLKTRVRIKCHYGYTESNGIHMITCNDDGNWSYLPSCVLETSLTTSTQTTTTTIPATTTLPPPPTTTITTPPPTMTTTTTPTTTTITQQTTTTSLTTTTQPSTTQPTATTPTTTSTTTTATTTTTTQPTTTQPTTTTTQSTTTTTQPTTTTTQPTATTTQPTTTTTQPTTTTTQPTTTTTQPTTTTTQPTTTTTPTTTSTTQTTTTTTQPTTTTTTTTQPTTTTTTTTPTTTSTTQTTTATIVCPTSSNEWITLNVLHPSFQVMLVTSVDVKRSGASVGCSGQSSNLVKIDDEWKQNDLARLIKECLDFSLTNYWIDGDKDGTNWRFSDSSIIPRTYWDVGTGTSNGEGCVSINNNQLWKSKNCNNKLDGYICERTI